jgi:hypothetical protein
MGEEVKDPEAGGEAALIATRMGKVKPAVLPVPVWAPASTSRPSRIRGMAFCWIGVAVW